MAEPKYYDLQGKEVVFYHPVDAFEAIELGLVTTGEAKVETAPEPKKEEPKIEEIAEASPPEEEPADSGPKKRAPRRRSAE
ncbi:MAG: hypothetical protein CL959_01590 [Euryarchaeota archaeon]|mgnify:CR=1 FL=1|nr:hypothetical protein [Euryarchaeota archaeon]